MAAAYDTHPQQGRAYVSAANAAKVLRKDVRTIRAMITNGTLEGVCEQAASRSRWHVYADQLEPRNQRPAHHDSDQVARLIEENAQLRARVANAEETTRSLLGAQAVLLDALRDYRTGSEQTVAAQAALEEAVKLQRAAASSFQSSSNQFAEAFSAMRDIVAAHNTPDDARDLLPEHLQ
ncbi:MULTISPECIES: hypothetical protein [Mycolicibacterium]|uniref:hypothetical protein n=1 Tax=Mycolicibacterium TaxID=1866885 RepID=UPI001CDB5286|nr:hypothetical protein [Mycolicibacterium fortuitum]UBV21690.1 hypothetical protein H8Z59_00070 [Mycolicibacterium fortuitum]